MLPVIFFEWSRSFGFFRRSPGYICFELNGQRQWLCDINDADSNGITYDNNRAQRTASTGYWSLEWAGLGCTVDTLAYTNVTRLIWETLHIIIRMND